MHSPMFKNIFQGFLAKELLLTIVCNASFLPAFVDAPIRPRTNIAFSAHIGEVNCDRNDESRGDEICYPPPSSSRHPIPVSSVTPPPITGTGRLPLTNR